MVLPYSTLSYKEALTTFNLNLSPEMEQALEERKAETHLNTTPDSLDEGHFNDLFEINPSAALDDLTSSTFTSAAGVTLSNDPVQDFYEDYYSESKVGN